MSRLVVLLLAVIVEGCGASPPANTRVEAGPEQAWPEQAQAILGPGGHGRRTEAPDVEPASYPLPDCRLGPPSVSQPSRTVRIETTPSGALVQYRARCLGRTPVTIEMPRDETWNVRLSLPDHLPREQLVSPTDEEVSVVLVPRERSRRGSDCVVPCDWRPQ